MEMLIAQSDISFKFLSILLKNASKPEMIGGIEKKRRREVPGKSASCLVISHSRRISSLHQDAQPGPGRIKQVMQPRGLASNE